MQLLHSLQKQWEKELDRKKMKGREKQPTWREKIERDIKIIRGELSLLSEITKGSNVEKSKRKNCSTNWASKRRKTYQQPRR